MQTTWGDRLTTVGFLALLTFVAFFSLRSLMRFGRQVKKNREAGVYADPEFRRRIRPLNILRLGLVAAEILLGVGAIWANQVGVAPEILMPFFLILFLPVAIGLGIVDRRWHKLMMKGVKQDPIN